MRFAEPKSFSPSQIYKNGQKIEAPPSTAVELCPVISVLFGPTTGTDFRKSGEKEGAAWGIFVVFSAQEQPEDGYRTSFAGMPRRMKSMLSGSPAGVNGKIVLRRRQKRIIEHCQKAQKAKQNLSHTPELVAINTVLIPKSSMISERNGTTRLADISSYSINPNSIFNNSFPQYRQTQMHFTINNFICCISRCSVHWKGHMKKK